MRLINADEITEVFEHLEESGIKNITLESVIDIIDDAPTVEVHKKITEENKAHFLRPCIANGKNARFHRWSARSEIIDPAIAVGGHNGGVIQWTVAIVEYEDGKVGEALPQNIRFVNHTESEAAEE